MRRFYRSRAARLLPPPPGRAPQTHKQIQLLYPLRTHTLQFCQGDTMILSYANPRRSLTLFAASTTLTVLNRSTSRDCWGEFFAETHVSTEGTPASQDAWVSYTHEDSGRPQGTCSAPQKRTSSSYADLKTAVARAWVFRATSDCCGARISKLCMARANAARALSLQFSSARSRRFGASLPGQGPRPATPTSRAHRMNRPSRFRTAGLASASRKLWAAQWCAIAFAAVSEKFCGAIGRRFLQDGTS